MSWLEKWSWKPATPARVPAGAPRPARVVDQAGGGCWRRNEERRSPCGPRWPLALLLTSVVNACVAIIVHGAGTLNRSGEISAGGAVFWPGYLNNAGRAVVFRQSAT